MSEITQYTFRGVDGSVHSVLAKVPVLDQQEVLVKITHTSLCGTDLVYIPSGIALGHEGIGIVQQIGSGVSQLKVGDRVGGGYHRGSCGHCKYCLSGRDIWCYERSIYGEGDYDNGTFSEYYVGKETYIHKIPAGIPSELAAPLQCAGATVYGAMVDVVKPFQRVGIIGIGGLGHLAIQFASKFGAEVVVFSTSINKEAEAKAFGAQEFYQISDLSKLTIPVDVLVLTGKRYPDWKSFLVKTVLSRAGTVIPLAEPDGNLELPAFQMFFEGYKVHTNLVASRLIHDDMLEFAAKHGIVPAVEIFERSEEGLRNAIEKLKSGSIRYRAVLVSKAESEI